MIEILNIIYSSNFILGYATFTAVMILLMVVLTIHDYIQTMKPFWKIEKKYKELSFCKKKADSYINAPLGDRWVIINNIN